MKPSPSAHQSTPSRVATSCFADVPLARLQELHDRDLPAPCHGAHHHAERRARLALAVAGVHEHERTARRAGPRAAGARSAVARSAMSCLRRSPYIATRECRRLRARRGPGSCWPRARTRTTTPIDARDLVRPGSPTGRRAASRAGSERPFAERRLDSRLRRANRTRAFRRGARRLRTSTSATAASSLIVNSDGSSRPAAAS